MKSQNFKNHDFARFEKNCPSLSTLALFCRIFKKHYHINLYIFNLYVILTFKSWKKILKIFFLAVTRLILNILIDIINDIIDIIDDVIIAIAAILNFFFYQFFVTLQSMTVPNFMSKAFSYQDLRRGGHHVPTQGHVQTKMPRGR